MGSRRAALDPELPMRVENATGILMLGQDPLHLAATLGGTPLAQAIRRANARSKTVAGVASAAPFLCQHMLIPAPTPAPLRRLATFAPGLGLVNRIALEATTARTPLSEAAVLRLHAAVAINPFLTGLGLEPDTAAVLYPDNTLQIYGANHATVVDGSAILNAELDAVLATPDAIEGVHRYYLAAGETYNLDDRSLHRPDPEDSQGSRITSAF
jgi:cyanophycinase